MATHMVRNLLAKYTAQSGLANVSHFANKLYWRTCVSKNTPIYTAGESSALEEGADVYHRPARLWIVSIVMELS